MDIEQLESCLGSALPEEKNGLFGGKSAGSGQRRETYVADGERNPVKHHLGCI